MNIQEVEKFALNLLSEEAIPVYDELNFSVLEFLRRLLRKDKNISAADQKDLLRLSRKLEIGRSLELAYVRESFVPLNGEDVCSYRIVEALLCVLLLSFELTDDYRFLNTVLKVSSYGLDVPPYENPSEEILSLLALSIEARLDA